MKDQLSRHEPFVPELLSTHRHDTIRVNSEFRKSRSEAGSDVSEEMANRIKQLEAENRRLQRLTITDDLTSAYNRRHFRTSYLSLLHSTARQPSIALCLFDIDHFKAYNDAYGHPMGDSVLRTITHAISPLLRRASDRLFRFGGDEFGALFCAPSAENAMAMIEAFQDAVQGLSLSQTPGTDAKLTATYGIAWHPDPNAANIDAKDFYSAADNTLYQAKHAGRDCILMRIMHDASANGETTLVTSRRQRG